MYWSRRFRRHLNRHTTSRITGVQDFDLPLDVPAIIVDGDQSGGGGERPQSRGWGDRPDSRAGSYGFGKAMGKDGVESEGETDGEGKPKMRATMDFSDARSSFLDMFGLGHDEAFSFQSHSRNSSRDSTFRARSPSPSPAASPLPARRTSIRSPISPSSGRSPGGLTARLHRVTSSVDESPIDTSEVIPERRGTVSRPVSTLGDVAMETFNDSAWGESLRRSFTVARRGSQEPPGGQGPLPPFAPPSPGAGRGPAI